MTTTPVKSARYDRETGDFCARVNGEIIGWAPTLLQAEALCSEHVYNLLSRPNVTGADLAPDEAEAVLEGQQLAALPDATPADAEAEAAQRELLEQEWQAGVEGARYTCGQSWPAGAVPADLAVYACGSCGGQFLREADWAGQYCATCAGGRSVPISPAVSVGALVVAPAAEVIDTLGGVEEDRCRNQPGAVRPAPHHAMIGGYSWRPTGQAGVAEVGVPGLWPQAHEQAERDSQAEILARTTPPRPPDPFDCPACENRGYVVLDAIGYDDDTGTLLFDYGPCEVCNGGTFDPNWEPTTTNAPADTDGDELAALLEAETALRDYAAFVAAPGSGAEAVCEWAAAMVRARIDCAGLLTLYPALEDLAAHVRVNVRPAEWLPFQERAAA